MKKYAEIIKAYSLMVAIVVVFGLSAFGLNFLTADLIAANGSSFDSGALSEVMPENNGFDILYIAENPSESKLSVLPTAIVPTGDKTDGTSGKITGVYKEKSGKGFVFTFEMITKFTKKNPPMVYTVGVNSDGTICGIVENEYYDSKTVGAGFVSSFVGANSSLAGVDLVAEVTYSSKAVVAGVSAGLTVLIENNLIAEGVITDAQILEGLISTVIDSYKKSSDTLSVSGNISVAYKLANDAGFVYIMTEGEATYLAICNNFGVSKVFTYETNETTGEFKLKEITSEKASLATEAATHATANAKAQFSKAERQFKKLVHSDAVITAITTQVNVFNTVVVIAEIVYDGNTYYGFYSRSYGFADMNVYVVLDEQGKIYAVSAATIVFEEYFYENDYGVVYEGIPSNYLENMAGYDSSTFDDELTFITAATMSSDAMALSIRDAFAAYNALKGGNN